MLLGCSREPREAENLPFLVRGNPARADFLSGLLAGVPRGWIFRSTLPRESREAAGVFFHPRGPPASTAGGGRDSFAWFDIFIRLSIIYLIALAVPPGNIPFRVAAADQQTCLAVQFVNLHRWLHIFSFHCSVLHLFDYNLELRSSSLTFGNASKLSFLSLNRDLFTIIDIDALCAGLAAEANAIQRVPPVK